MQNKLELYANPFAFGAKGFYFGTLAEYKEKAAGNFSGGCLVEEYEIEIISGPLWAVKLNGLINGELEVLFEAFDYIGFDDLKGAGFCFGMDHTGGNIREALELLKSDRFEYHGPGNIADYLADNYNLDVYSRIPAFNVFGMRILDYIDWESIARDAVLNGEIRSIEYNGGNYIIEGRG